MQHSVSAALINLLSVFALYLVFGITYISFNLITTAHVLPISAAVKQIFFVPFSDSWTATIGNDNFALTALAITPLVLSALVLLWRLREQNKSTAREHEYAAMLAAVSVLLFYVYLFAYDSNFFAGILQCP